MDTASQDLDRKTVLIAAGAGVGLVALIFLLTRGPGCPIPPGTLVVQPGGAVGRSNVWVISKDCRRFGVHGVGAYQACYGNAVPQAFPIPVITSIVPGGLVEGPPNCRP